MNGLKSPEEITEDLTYINYAHNRRNNPTISAERWAAVYGPKAESLETQYQNDVRKN